MDHVHGEPVSSELDDLEAVEARDSMAAISNNSFISAPSIA